MPYTINESNGEFWVVNAATGKRQNKKPYSSRQRALRYQRALEANMPKTEKGGMLQSVKAMMDMSMDPEAAEAYARQELWDIGYAASAIQILTSLSSEMDEPDDAKEVADIMRGLCNFIMGEIDEMEQAAQSGDDDGEGGEGGDMSMMGKQIGVTRDNIPIFDMTGEKSAAKADAPDGDFLVVDKEGQHLRVKRNGKPDHGLMGSAWAALTDPNGFRGNKYEGKDKQKAIDKLRALYKSEGMDIPGEKKSLDMSYAKSLGIQFPDMPELAVKFVGRDTIRGYTFLWGNPEKRDIEREYFTPKTDFWDGTLGKSVRPLTWDHAQDGELKADPRIGEILDFGDDEVGRWYEAKLDRAHRYRKAVDQLIKDGVLGTSSDSAPQYVVREKTGKATWLKQWPWFASALTDVPCEPRMIGSIEILKAWGIPLPEAGDDRSRQIEILALREREARIRSHIGGS